MIYSSQVPIISTDDDISNDVLDQIHLLGKPGQHKFHKPLRHSFIVHED